jgi:hypothetical protein
MGHVAIYTVLFICQHTDSEDKDRKRYLCGELLFRLPFLYTITHCFRGKQQGSGDDKIPLMSGSISVKRL